MLEGMLGQQHAAGSFFSSAGYLTNHYLHYGLSVSASAKMKTLQCSSWHCLKEGLD